MSSHPASASDQEGFLQSPVSDNSKPKTKNSKLVTENSTLKTQNSKLCFVCVGAGRGSRFGGDKLAQALGGRTVFEAALGALVAAIPTAPLVVVVAPERLQAWRNRLRPDFPEALLVGGGARRQDSVRAGVEAAIALGAEVVAIHDAARPLVNARDVVSVVDGLGGADGAILTARVSDTVKRITSDDLVTGTMDRDGLRLALTPQVVRVACLLKAWETAGGNSEWTDESALLENAGMRVRSVVARHPNPKITTPSDLHEIRALVEVAG